MSTPAMQDSSSMIQENMTAFPDMIPTYAMNINSISFQILSTLIYNCIAQLLSIPSPNVHMNQFAMIVDGRLGCFPLGGGGGVISMLSILTSFSIECYSVAYVQDIFADPKKKSSKTFLSPSVKH